MSSWNRLFGYDVFISYSSHDKAWAAAVENLLKHGRYSVFRDHSGLTTGDHLERLLREVRRSTMLLVLVGGAAMQSDWVHRELLAHPDRPKRRWPVAPVFIEDRYPRELPERFRQLGQFHGVTLPTARLLPAVLERDHAFLKDTTSHFDAVRRSALRRWLAFATSVAVMTAVTSLVWLNRRNTQRDEWLARAEGFMASSRFIDAESALAHAWQLDPSASTLAAYRQAQSRRALERSSWVTPVINSRQPGPDLRYRRCVSFAAGVMRFPASSRVRCSAAIRSPFSHRPVLAISSSAAKYSARETAGSTRSRAGVAALPGLQPAEILLLRM